VTYANQEFLDHARLNAPLNFPSMVFFYISPQYRSSMILTIRICQ